MLNFHHGKVMQLMPLSLNNATTIHPAIPTLTSTAVYFHSACLNKATTIHSAIPSLTSINVCFHSARPFHSNGFCSPSSAIIF
ncbi:hypothetical protein CesoFtcFv8_006356 [Champsocephalus esox]|uniref:Uncharacterized protein n=1 Tax=Champsocephalus esox TaxID=159716 RepID=A0AAN8CLW7_9TELE|nr:hypothetical protein CesoFtcFv8_006356 [Champsocephalus esox]